MPRRSARRGGHRGAAKAQLDPQSAACEPQGRGGRDGPPCFVWMAVEDRSRPTASCRRHCGVSRALASGHCEARQNNRCHHHRSTHNTPEIRLIRCSDSVRPRRICFDRLGHAPFGVTHRRAVVCSTLACPSRNRCVRPGLSASHCIDHSHAITYDGFNSSQVDTRGECGTMCYDSSNLAF